MSQNNRHTDKVAQGMAQRILASEWPVGHKLPADSALCAEFSVSRTVIREALRLLGGKGLLTARPRIGTTVADKADWMLWDSDILQWLEALDDISAYLSDARDIRLAIEPMLAALAAARADDNANSALQQALRDMDDAESELAFLTALYRAANNQFADAAVHLTAFTLRHRLSPPPMAVYRELTAAVAQKDSAGARQAAFQAILSTT